MICTVAADITYLIFIKRDITQHVAAFIWKHHFARRWGRKRSWTVVVRGPARMSRLHQNQHVEAPCDIELVLESSEVIGLAFRLKSKLQRYCRSWDTSPERTRAGPGTPEGFFNSGECNAQVFFQRCHSFNIQQDVFLAWIPYLIDSISIHLHHCLKSRMVRTCKNMD